MFATYHSHSMLPAAPADAPFLGYATPGAIHNERLTITMQAKETLVQARPKVGLRTSNIACAPASEQTAIPVYTGPAEFVVPLSASAPQPPSATPTSPPRAYGRPRRLPLSVRHGRRVSATPTSPSGSSKPSSAPASRTMTFESITCTPQLHSTSFEVRRLRKVCVERRPDYAAGTPRRVLPCELPCDGACAHACDARVGNVGYHPAVLLAFCAGGPRGRRRWLRSL